MHENLNEETKAVIAGINAIKQEIKSINVFDLFKVHKIFPNNFYEFHDIKDITVYGLRYTSNDTVDDELVSKLTDFKNAFNFAENILHDLSSRVCLTYVLPTICTHIFETLRQAILHNPPRNMTLNTTTSTYCVKYELSDFNNNAVYTTWKKIKSFKSENIYDNMMYQYVKITTYPFDTNSHETNTFEGDDYPRIETKCTEYFNTRYEYNGTVIGYNDTYIVLQHKDGTKHFIKNKDICDIKVLTNY